MLELTSAAIVHRVFYRCIPETDRFILSVETPWFSTWGTLFGKLVRMTPAMSYLPLCSLATLFDIELFPAA